MALRSQFTLALLLTAAASFAASSFELSGSVLGDSGEGLSGAALTLVHETSSLVRTTTTNASGHYTFAALPPGEYTLEVKLEGYATSRYAGLRYFADTKPVFNITLRRRSVQESMTFTGEAPLVNVSQSQVGLSVENRQLRELPLAPREYVELIILEGAGGEIVETPPTAPVAGAPLTALNGMSPHYTAYELDGLGNTRDQHGVPHVDVDIEAIEELRVVSGQASSEYGQSLGGLVSAATKSGGRDVHGSVFAFVRPGGFESSDTLTGRETSSSREELGFALGGPLASEHTELFASFSYAREDDVVVVTAPFDDGRFRGVFTLPSELSRALAKLSHMFSERHQIFVKGAFSNLDRVDGVGGLDIFDNRLDVDNDDVAVSGTLTSEIGPAFSELRFGWSSERFRARGQPAPFGAVQIHPTGGHLGNPTALERVDERHIEIADTLSFLAGDHSVKTGFRFLDIRSTSELARYGDGVQYFAPADPERPILFWKSVVEGGPTVLERSERHVGLFVQDDWQLTPFITVNLGLRWSKETSVPDNDNVAPRLGILWDATGDGRTAVRAGYGLFHGFVFSIVDTLERLYGPEGRRVVALTPGDPGFTEAVATGVVPPEAANVYVDATRYAATDRRTPYSHHFTLGIEREIVPAWTVSVDLSYIRGENLILPVDLNGPTFFDYTGGGVRSGAEADAGRPFGAPGAPIPPGAAGALPDGFPFGGYRDLYLLSSRGSSRYWGVRLSLARRFATDYSIQATYNESRSTNNGDDYRILDSLPLDPAAPGLEWGRSATDIPHTFALNAVWNAPFGIRVAALGRIRSGRPVDPRVDEDLDGDRKLRERAFRNGAILERNSFRTKSQASLDLSFGKAWELGESRNVVVSLDAFNLTNRLNPRQVLRSFGRADAPLPAFLQIAQAGPPRRLRLSVRFSF